jgi:predicted amidohydrolase
VQALSQAARELGIAIAFGMAELDELTQLRYNSLVALNQSGEIAGVYRKMHLWSSEKEWAEKGDSVPLFEVAGVRASGWICYDTRFPEVGRLAALAGADVGLVATAWLGPGEEWEVCLRARALDNSLFVAGADIISYDPKLRCWGRSLIINPKGKILAQAQPEREGIIDAVLKGEELDAQRNRVPLLRDRFPNLYGALVK